MRLTLSRAVSLAVLARSRSAADHHEELGCSILGPPSREVRRAHAALKRRVQALGADEAARQARALVQWMEAAPRYAALCRGTSKRAGRRLLREDVLFPDVEAHRPRVLHLRRDELGLDVPVRSQDWPTVQALFATLAHGASAAELRSFSSLPATAALLADLRAAGWLERFEAPSPAADVVFVGHNSTLMRGKTGRVLVDPYFRPASRFDLPSCQPMQPRDLGPIDAVLITHSHGDHFHLGSLLQLPRDVRVFVPPVERESLFSTDCRHRLEQLGFTRVEALDWWATRQVGDVTVQALPFYGEQPTDGRGVYPALSNVGSAWSVRTPALSAAFFADSGRDVRGDMAEVARRAGPVDVLFCGVRGFKLRPIFFGFTTLDSFLVNVPVEALTTPQQLMADGDTALSYAAALGASHLVPCADGGAPWYWREGMGPRYPGYPGTPVTGASTWDEHPDADPYPERVVAARGGPQVLLLRPGAEVSWRGRGPRLSHRAPFTWPFSLGGAR
jgi:L-ascorbate metabolism protein UlaG (beta-lactamase superfamily)